MPKLIIYLWAIHLLFFKCAFLAVNCVDGVGRKVCTVGLPLKTMKDHRAKSVLHMRQKKADPIGRNVGLPMCAFAYDFLIIILIYYYRN